MSKRPRELFGGTIFLSAFLLFQIQPMIGRLVLPRMGGGAAVWTACMLFFQLILLLGYAYTHFLAPRFGRVHAIVLLSFLAFPLRPNFARLQTETPVESILLFLALTIGLPCVPLASTAPLLQRCFSLRWPEAASFRLYALSNAGSLLALLSYPFLTEPYITFHLHIPICPPLFHTLS